MAKNKYYGVKVGLQVGVFESWPECELVTKGYPGAVYKGFPTRAEADAFVRGEQVVLPKEEKKEETVSYRPFPGLRRKSYAFVDGSYNASTRVYGAGGFVVDDSGKRHVVQGNGSDPEMASMRNVAGEVLAATLAINKAIELGMKELTIYFDYQGIESWATGEWKRNKKGTKEYYEFCQRAKSKITLKFVKVKGHSGVEGNEEADRLAKDAAGVK